MAGVGAWATGRRGRRRQRQLQRSHHTQALRISPLRQGKGHSNKLLHSPPIKLLPPEDHNLATALMRWQNALERALHRPVGTGPEQSGGAGVRMGAFKLHMDQDSSARREQERENVSHSHAVGMVNATAQVGGERHIC